MGESTPSELELRQQALCRETGCEYSPLDLQSTFGYALGTEGKLPINGLRHKPAGQSNGWYIWRGEELSDASDFFSPLHAHHLFERCPEALKFLGLPPGYRFLLAGDYVDVWFDGSLLLDL